MCLRTFGLVVAAPLHQSIAVSELQPLHDYWKLSPSKDPFVFGRHVFMHNGIISDFHGIRREMTTLLAYDAYCNILGSTDSEHAAALYVPFPVHIAS